jgi:hypothetical protein
MPKSNLGGGQDLDALEVRCLLVAILMPAPLTAIRDPRGHSKVMSCSEYCYEKGCQCSGFGHC